MTEAVSPPLADTSDMKGMHRVFRDAVSSAIAYIGSTNPQDKQRVELVATYFDNVLRLLHAHHEGEDELLTPRLVQRCTADEAAEVTRVAAQHHDVLGTLNEAEAAIAAWRGAPSLESAVAASTAVAALASPLTSHLDDEEKTVLPIAGRYITAPEWGELPAHGMQHFTGDKLWLILGLIQEQMTPEGISVMEAHMPPPLASFWTQQGRPMFIEFVGRLRG